MPDIMPGIFFCDHGRDQARKQVISRAVIVAVGITANGQREVLGIEVGDSEDEAFWTAFLRRLRERGLNLEFELVNEQLGVPPCISKEVRSYQRNHQGVQPMNSETDLRRQISW